MGGGHLTVLFQCSLTRGSCWQLACFAFENGVGDDTQDAQDLKVAHHLHKFPYRAKS